MINLLFSLYQRIRYISPVARSGSGSGQISLLIAINYRFTNRHFPVLYQLFDIKEWDLEKFYLVHKTHIAHFITKKHASFAGTVSFLFHFFSIAIRSFLSSSSRAISVQFSENGVKEAHKGRGNPVSL